MSTQKLQSVAHDNEIGIPIGTDDYLSPFNDLKGKYVIICIDTDEEGRKTKGKVQKKSGHHGKDNWTYERAKEELPKFENGVIRFLADLEHSPLFCIDIDEYDADWDKLVENIPLLDCGVRTPGTTKGNHVFFQKTDCQGRDLMGEIFKKQVKISLAWDIDFITGALYMSPHEVISHGFCEYNISELKAVFSRNPKQFTAAIKARPLPQLSPLITAVPVDAEKASNAVALDRFINELVGGEFNASWTVNKEDLAHIMLEHDSMHCCVNPGYQHTVTPHSRLYFNEGKYIVANCLSHTSKKIKISALKAKELRGYFGIETQDDKLQMEARKVLHREIIGEDYEGVKKRFEKKNAYIAASTSFLSIEELPGGGTHYQLRKKNDFDTHCRIWSYKAIEKGKEVEKRFIQKWLDDPHRKRFRKLGMYPYGANASDDECPEDEYNTWAPYAMSTVSDYADDQDAVNEFKELIFHLVGKNNVWGDLYNPEHGEYFLRWIAHMIKFPQIKPSVSIILSDKRGGVGKGTVLHILRAMLGDDKVVESSNPAEEVWGHYNNMVEDAILISLNEVGKKDMGKQGRIKALVGDDPKINIRRMYQDPYKGKTYARVLVTTNNIDPMPISEENRRFVFFESSSARKLDEAYWVKMHRIAKNRDSVKSIYEFLAGLDVDENEFHSEAARPVTEFEESCLESNQCPVKAFSHYMLLDGAPHSPRLELLRSALYDLFKTYSNIAGLEYRKNQSGFSHSWRCLKLSWVKSVKRDSGDRRWIIDLDAGRKLNSIVPQPYDAEGDDG